MARWWMLWSIAVGCGAPEEFAGWPGATWDELEARSPRAEIGRAHV